MKYFQLQARDIKTRYFDLRHTFESAQPLTFYADFDHTVNAVTYPSGAHLINMIFYGNSKEGRITVLGKDLDYISKEINSRFRLNDDMEKIYSGIATDKFMRESIEKYHGMRVTLNDPWETTLCFIVSQYNNVKRIRGIIKNLVNRYGSNISDDNDRLAAKSFPKSSDFINATVKGLEACGTGFRANYIKEAAEYCTNNIDLYKLGSKGYTDLKAELTEISGVGDKVADCIALMGYGKLEAFPIDVWVQRTIENIYFKGKKKTIKELHQFAEERFGPYAGYAQQYIFWSGMHIPKRN